MWPDEGKIIDDYQTPDGSGGWLGKLFPSLVYYPKAYWVVNRAARLCKKGRYDSEAWTRSSGRTLRALESVGVRFQIENAKVLSKLDSPCLFVGNHMSTLETFVLPCMIQPYREVSFVVKKSLIDYPIFKHVMRSRDPVVVEYKSPRADLKTMLKGCEDRLAKGVSMVVFPQGRRTTQFDPAGFNTLGIKIAKKMSVPIVPFALRTDAWSSNGPLIKDWGKIRPACPVHFAFGEPMEVDGHGRDCQQRIIEFIQERYTKWIEEYPFPEQW